MKKVFISLPMNGFSNEDIKQRIERYHKEAVQIVGEGWTQARGCRIEHLCAESYGIPIIQGGNNYGN